MSGRRKINKYFISSVEWYEPRLNITSEFWGSENTTDDELIPGICTPYNVDENDDIYDNHDRGDNDDDGNDYVNEYGEPRIPFVPGINFLLHPMNFMVIAIFML